MLKRYSSVLLLLCASAIGLSAQHPLPLASLSGKLIDALGASVSDATVTVLQDETLVSQFVTSDQQGNFRFPYLSDGHYEMTVHQGTFADVKKAVTIHAGHPVDLTISLISLDEQAVARVQQFILESPHESAANATTLHLEPTPDSSPPAEASSDNDLLHGLATIHEFRMAGNSGSIHPSQPSGIGLLHAEVYGILGSSLVGFDTLQRPVQLPSMRDGAALGASINHNRTSYFLGFDRQRLFSALPADGSLLQSLGQRIGPSGSLLPNGSSGSAQSSSQLFARLDHRLSERDSVNVRYGRSSIRSNSLRGGTPDFAQPVDALQQNGAIDNTAALSPGTLNETRGQFIEGKMQVPAGAPGYAIQSNLATVRRFRVYEAADNITHQVGSQNLRAGGDFLFNQMSVSFLEGSLGNATFSQSSRSAGFYAQNRWKMNPNLVLTAGVRYDLEFLENVKTDTNNLTPQVGFAWSPGGSRSTVIRGGYGLMYEQLPLPVISGALDAGGNAVNLLRSGNVVVGRNSLPISALGSFNTVNPSIQNAYAEQAHLEFEQQLSTRSAFTATYQHVHGVDLAGPVDSAAPLCVGAGVCNAGNEFQRGRQYNSSSSSTYDGLTVAFVQHPIYWGDYSVAYTYADGQSSQDQRDDAFVGDQMRRVAFHGTLHTALDPGWGLWQHFTHGVALSGYGDFTRRNELPGLDFIHWNAQLTKGFQMGTRTRLELIAQTYNMLEHRNYSANKAISELGEYGGAMLSSYERFAAIGAPSGTQLGLQLKF